MPYNPFYIATSLSNAKNHNSVRDALQSLGYTIAYDWTLHGSVKLVSKKRLQEVAVAELKGILQSAFVVVLLPGGKGTHFEFGYALAGKKRVFLYSEDPASFELGPQANAFYHHPDVIQLTGCIDQVALKIHKKLHRTTCNPTCSPSILEVKPASNSIDI